MDFPGKLLQVIEESGADAGRERSSMAAGVLEGDFKGLPRFE